MATDPDSYSFTRKLNTQPPSGQLKTDNEVMPQNAPEVREASPPVVEIPPHEAGQQQQQQQQPANTEDNNPLTRNFNTVDPNTWRPNYCPNCSYYVGPGKDPRLKS